MKKTWRIITMKNSIRKNMKKRLAGMMTVASVMLIGVSPITAFAQVPECTCETKCTEDCVDPDCEICKEDISLCEGTEADPVEEPDTEETYGPLTPDGNLSLVDDYGTIEAGGKQFITVVTKSGNYFYIIIDRDDEGDETVHFLNMVDESDLLSLMDDEEAQAYVDSIAASGDAKEATTEEAVEETSEESAEVETVATEKKTNYTGIMALVLLVTVGGIGGYIYMKSSKNKKPKSAGSDPDADYRDDEEDYLAGLSEDDELEDEEIAEDFDEDSDDETKE